MEPEKGDDLAVLERNTRLLIGQFEEAMKANLAVYERNILLLKILKIVLPQEELDKLIKEHEH